MLGGRVHCYNALDRRELRATRIHRVGTNSFESLLLRICRAGSFDSYGGLIYRVAWLGRVDSLNRRAPLRSTKSSVHEGAELRFGQMNFVGFRHLGDRSNSIRRRITKRMRGVCSKHSNQHKNLCTSTPPFLSISTTQLGVRSRGGRWETYAIVAGEFIEELCVSSVVRALKPAN